MVYRRRRLTSVEKLPRVIITEWWANSRIGSPTLLPMNGITGRSELSSNNEDELNTYAWFPPFRCRSSVAVSPFYRCKIPLLCKNYVRKFRFVTAVNGKKIRNGSGNGNGVRKRQRLTGTAKRQRKNGNGMVETRHYCK